MISSTSAVALFVPQYQLYDKAITRAAQLKIMYTILRF